MTFSSKAKSALISSLYSRSMTCNTNCSSSCIAFGCSFFRARLPKSSSCPTLKKEGATRVVIATSSSTITSGSFEYEPSLNHGLATFSLVEVYSVKERDVATPRACICSCAKNSRILERRTALPSAPRQ